VTAQPNAELAYRVLDHIDAHPQNWEQGRWIGQEECGTVACFAGWAVLLSDLPVRDEFVWIEGEDRHVAEVAEELLGIADLPADHAVRAYAAERLALLDGLGHTTSKGDWGDPSMPA
jgi:hypothetical protein